MARSNPKTFKYYSGDIQVHQPFTRRREEVRAKFPDGRILKYDDFFLLVALTPSSVTREDYVPVTRMIKYDENGSKHQCDGRCRHAKRQDCECSCGGQYHGIER